MDRGFNMMVPKAKEVVKTQHVFDYEIKFVLFKKEFNLSFKVKQRNEK